MLSEKKLTSDTRLHQHESASSLLPLKEIISLREKIHNYSIQSSIKSIDDDYQRFSNNNLINTHFPIAKIQQDSTIISKTSSSKLPTVPKRAGTFIHRFVNKLFSMTNTNENIQDLSRIKRKQMNTTLSNDSHTCRNLTLKKRRRQRLKPTRNKNSNKHCGVCRRYRNCFSILPTDSYEYTSQSPMIFNTNATTTLKTHSGLAMKPSISLPKIQFEKRRALNESQYQTIVSAVELIFDTFMSNYQ